VKEVFLTLIVSLMITGGQILWKTAIAENGGFLKSGVALKLSIFQVVMSPYFLIGGLFYGSSTILWLYLLGKYEYSLITPLLLSITQLVTILAAIFIFKENINMFRWIGVVFIFLGILFLNKTN